MIRSVLPSVLPRFGSAPAPQPEYKIENRGDWMRYLTQQGVPDPKAYIDQREPLMNQIYQLLLANGIQNSAMGVSYYSNQVTLHYGKKQEGFELTKALNRLPDARLQEEVDIPALQYGIFKLDFEGQPFKIVVQKEPYACGYRLGEQLERDRLDD